MTDEQMTQTPDRRHRWIGPTLVAAISALIAMMACAGDVFGQSGPIMRHGELLRVYVGQTTAPGTDWRVIVGTTWSVSPNADIGPPFDEASENPDRWYRASELRVVAPGDPCVLQPELNLPCRDTGWIDVQVPDVKIEVPYRSGNWVPDVDMRLMVHTVDAKRFGLCAVTACGAVLNVARVKLSDVLEVPTTFKRRAVIH